MLEKFAGNFLAGMPCLVKPATATSYLTAACVRLMQDSGALPEGALQLIIGGTGDLLDQLDEQDMVTFTGSANTARKLRAHPNIINRSIPSTPKRIRSTAPSSPRTSPPTTRNSTCWPRKWSVK
ncbi:Bifunctional protein PaaZ [Alcanivorax sp. ALC70]|nr:Bifunctional protein PaaZ [Alcanivorax sp. ALC70]